MNITAVIPARHGSTRLPGKPLAQIGGLPMIEHVWRRVSSVVPDTIIATDSEEIARIAEDFGAHVILTSSDIPTGTLRCIEAYRKSASRSDVMLNIQGDEPFISPTTIEAVIERLAMPDAPDVATAATIYNIEEGYQALADPNRVKVVTDSCSRALYFSRAVIPAARAGKLIPGYPYLIHHGIYAFRSSVLERIASAGECGPAEVEKLEQLAWLYGGCSVGVAVVADAPFAIDTPHDLRRANEKILP